MRTVDSNLVTLLKTGRVANPLYKLTVTGNSGTVTYTKDDILSIDHMEEAYSGKATVFLKDGSTGTMTNYTGRIAYLSYGAKIGNTEYYVDTGCMYCSDALDTKSVQPSHVYRLVFKSVFDMIADDKASVEYTNDDLVSVQDLITDIFNGASAVYVDSFTHCKAWTVNIDDLNDPLLDWSPQKEFIIKAHLSTRLSVLQFLLEYTNSGIKMGSDGQLHIFTLTIADDTNAVVTFKNSSGYPYFQLLNFKHDFVNPNKVIVQSNPTDVPQYSGDYTYSGHYSRFPITDYKYATLTSDAQGDDIAEALINRAYMRSVSGSLISPLELQVEVYDPIDFWDAPSNQDWANISAIHRRVSSFKNEWTNTIYLGGFSRSHGIFKDLVDDAQIGDINIESVDLFSQIIKTISDIVGVQEKLVTAVNKMDSGALETGDGDMLKVVYDTDDDGKVETADTADIAKGINDGTYSATAQNIKDAVDKKDANITKALLTAAGDIIYASAASTPAVLAKGANDKVLMLKSGLPSWETATVDHSRQHAITSTSDHTSSATPGKLLKADASGLPVECSDAVVTDGNVHDAIDKAHTRSHSITGSSDHTGTAADNGYILKADGNGLPIKATNTDTDVADAVTKKHSHASAPLLNVLDDTTPELGGALDTNGEEVNSLIKLLFGADNLTSISIKDANGNITHNLHVYVKDSDHDALVQLLTFVHETVAGDAHIDMLSHQIKAVADPTADTDAVTYGKVKTIDTQDSVTGRGLNLVLHNSDGEDTDPLDTGAGKIKLVSVSILAYYPEFFIFYIGSTSSPSTAVSMHNMALAVSEVGDYMYTTLTALVPNGWYYKLYRGGGTNSSISSWVEQDLF